MIRCTIEMVPGSSEANRYTLGVVEIANVSNLAEVSNYVVVLKKTAPYSGALREAWRKGVVQVRRGEVAECLPLDDDELTVRSLHDFNRVKRGCYDLLYRALRACGLEERNPA